MNRNKNPLKMGSCCACNKNSTTNVKYAKRLRLFCSSSSARRLVVVVVVVVCHSSSSPSSLSSFVVVLRRCSSSLFVVVVRRHCSSSLSSSSLSSSLLPSSSTSVDHRDGSKCSKKRQPAMESKNATQAMTTAVQHLRKHEVFRSLFQKRRRQILSPRPAMESENETCVCRCHSTEQYLQKENADHP